MIVAVMKHHVYQFYGNTRKQEDGGPIGLELSGSIARVFMLRWDRQFLHLARENGLKLHLYFRYIDDQNQVTEALPPGTRWGGEKRSVMPEEIEADKEIPADKMTMRELRKMGNSISPMIHLEEDTSSHHDNKKLPILDLNVWTERKDDENDTTSENVRYQFYRKPMANALLIMARSAMPEKIKRTALTQQALRIMKNTSPELAEEEKTQLLSEFSNRMRASGCWNHQQCHDCLW